MKKTTFLFSFLYLCLSGLQAVTPPTMQFWPDYAAGSAGAFCRVDFECRISNGGFKTGGLCWNTTGNPTLDDASATYRSKTSTNFLCQMTGLEPATRYYVRPYITTINPEETYYGETMCVYTIPAGNLTYTNRYNKTDDADSTVYKRIEAIGQHGQQLYRDWTSISKHVWLNYSPGTPTADANYEGWINIGANTSYQRTGTLLHELNHVMGSGTWSGWGDLFDASGKWKGHRANEVVWLITGDSSVHVQKSGVHFYLKNTTVSEYSIGINGAHEDHSSEFQYIFNCLVTQAFTEDGLPFNYQSLPIPGFSLKVKSDTTNYYIKPATETWGRYTSYLRDNDGLLELAQCNGSEAISDPNAAWHLEYLPADRRYVLKNAGTGRYLSTTTQSGRTVLPDSRDADNPNPTLFQLIRTLDGAITDTCDAMSITTQSYSIVGNPAQNMALDFSTISKQVIPIGYKQAKESQQWVFFTEEQALLFDQVNGLTALPQRLAGENIRLHPADGCICVSNLPDGATVNCFDISGRTIARRVAQSSNVEIAVGQGMYIVSIETAQGRMARKVVCQ